MGARVCTVMRTYPLRREGVKTSFSLIGPVSFLLVTSSGAGSTVPPSQGGENMRESMRSATGSLEAERYKLPTLVGHGACTRRSKRLAGAVTLLGNL